MVRLVASSSRFRGWTGVRELSRGALLMVLVGLFGIPQGAGAQVDTRLQGSVVDSQTGAPVADVTIRVVGTDLSAVSDASGRFTINDVPFGRIEVSFAHLAYGSSTEEVFVRAGITIVRARLALDAIELDPLDVVGQTTEQSRRRGRGSSQWVVDREEIIRALGTSRHLGDLVRQTIPGIKVRQANTPTASGSDVCIEFRAAAQISLMPGASPCKSPMVFLDGVPVGDPTSLYSALSLETIESIEMLPPGEAGARYGTGSLHGVMLIETGRPGRTDQRLGVPVDRSLSSFDWDQDPAGHNTGRVMLSSFGGNALGLALGVAAAQTCIGIDAKDEIVTTCSTSGTLAAGAAALLLPAIGGALGARWAGGTEDSIGRLVPATASAILMLVPGYAFSLSTQGGSESDVANVFGGTLLVIGVPALLTVADRLFRELR